MNKRGISLISLSITITIMLVIVSVVGITLTFSTTNAKTMVFAKEIYNIQSIVAEYIERESALPTSAETITIIPSDLTQFDMENIIDGKVVLSVLDLTEIDIKNTNYGNKTVGSNDAEKAKDVYAVSESTGIVYYIAGFKGEDVTYYTLTDDLRQMIEKDKNIGEGEAAVIGESTVTFKASKVGWTKEGVTVTVFVPSEFTAPSITLNNNNITYTTQTTAGGVTYIVNDEKLNQAYTITVKYSKNGISGMATYSTKMDNTAPIISKEANISNTSTQIKGLTATDEGSGIKYFRYAEGAMNDDENISKYMKAYGKNINKGNIKFETATVYTLYAEDKAGNYTIIYIDNEKVLTDVKPEMEIETDDLPYTDESLIDKRIGLTSAVPYESGTGTSSDPYIIVSAEQLAYLAKQVNSGKTYKGKYFCLESDIELIEYEWIPIGNNNKNKFDGNFNGNGHSIQNIIVEEEYSYRGLFGNVGKNAVLSGIFINNAGAMFGREEVCLGDFIGTIAGVNRGRIEFCEIENIYINGKNYVGGLVGYNLGILVDCRIMTSEIHGFDYIGGISGYNSGKIENGNVNDVMINGITTTLKIGAIVGFNEGTLYDNVVDGMYYE